MIQRVPGASGTMQATDVMKWEIKTVLKTTGRNYLIWNREVSTQNVVAENVQIEHLLKTNQV